MLITLGRGTPPIKTLHKTFIKGLKVYSLDGPVKVCPPGAENTSEMERLKGGPLQDPSARAHLKSETLGQIPHASVGDYALTCFTLSPFYASRAAGATSVC